MEVSMSPPQIYVEKTLAIIKPDVVDKEEEIQDIILRSGFTIVQRRKLRFSPEQCSNFYVEQYGKMFFPNLTVYMSSGPLVAMILARHKAISYWKELLGPSNSLIAKETHPDSLRAIYGTDDLRNALHGSNDFAAAEREIRFMFPKGSDGFRSPREIVVPFGCYWHQMGSLRSTVCHHAHAHHVLAAAVFNLRE
ncbi:nucleoside diphosphate kinase homolog 5 [Lepus europaeus]|uniref:nucleoside diphosphate kinase homolog 5 n=1 Tax=Lepus europaeus TaxID=9983 RepID=UPI002B45BD00|nr:nucleoside diphosphate kinase homolog 5 [Lepus europaeus]